MIDRRVFIGIGSLLLGALAAPLLLRRTTPSDNVVFFNGGGGRWQANARKAWFEPFEQSTGISVVDTFPFNLGKLETMVKTQSVQWDLTDIPSVMVGEAIRRDLLEPIDYNVVDRNLLPSVNYGSHYVVYTRYSYNLLYSTRRYKGKPDSIADLWNMQQFPGPRSLRQLPVPLLEWALIADGVNVAELYPIDVDRALRKLDEIKHAIRWWSSGAESIQLVAQGEADIGASFNTRIMQARDEGVEMDISWNHGALAGLYMVVPKGAKNKHNAMRLINAMIGAEGQSRMALLNGSAPVNPRAFDYIDPDMATDFATHPTNASRMFAIDEQGYWAKNYLTVKEQFDEWLLSE